MRTIHRNALRWLFMVFFASILLKYPAEASAQVAVNGNVKQVGTHSILNLWGSNYEMGYAHGYLLADKIRDIVDKFLIGTVIGGNVTRYQDFLNQQAQAVIFFPKYLEEINGIVAGMKASGKNLYVLSLNRNIDERDIRALNRVLELEQFGCSSFGVWGNATADGETVLARNLEFYFDSQGYVVNYQIVITYSPTGGPDFVSFSWPGFVGLVSGINEYGITLTTNTGNGSISRSAGPFHPSLEVMRYILESTTPANYLTQPLSIVNSVEEYTSRIIQVAAPYNGVNDPVYYIEDDRDQNVIRYASDTNPQYDHVIATNHFIVAQSPPPSSDSSVYRYNQLENGLTALYATGDRKVDSTEAWPLLGLVAVYPETLTSMVIRPNRMEFDLSFAKLVNNNFTSATAIQPQTYTWAGLFPNHGPLPQVPDLVVQSIVANPATAPPGQPVNATVTVRNQGGAAAGGFQIDFYKNLTSAPALQQFGDVNCSKAGLAAGATDSCTFTITYATGGTYRAWAQVDANQLVAELEEANNVSGPQTIVVSSPDLVLSSISVPLMARACGTVSVADTTRNSGQVPSGVSTTRFYWSKNSTYDSSDSSLGYRSIGPLNAGASSSGNTAVKIPCGIATGTYYIVGIADADNAVLEGSETNNTKSRSIYIRR